MDDSSGPAAAKLSTVPIDVADGRAGERQGEGGRDNCDRRALVTRYGRDHVTQRTRPDRDHGGRSPGVGVGPVQLGRPSSAAPSLGLDTLQTARRG